MVKVLDGRSEGRHRRDFHLLRLVLRQELALAQCLLVEPGRLQERVAIRRVARQHRLQALILQLEQRLLFASLIIDPALLGVLVQCHTAVFIIADLDVMLMGDLSRVHERRLVLDRGD